MEFIKKHVWPTLSLLLHRLLPGGGTRRNGAYDFLDVNTTALAVTTGVAANQFNRIGNFRTQSTRKTTGILFAIPNGTTEIDGLQVTADNSVVAGYIPAAMCLDENTPGSSSVEYARLFVPVEIQPGANVEVYAYVNAAPGSNVSIKAILGSLSTT